MVFAQYLKTPFEFFTDKYILARGVFNLLEEGAYNKADYDEIIFIETFTHPDVKVSLYKLDRNVNPSKGEFKTVENKFTYYQETPENEAITLTDSQAQNYLCIAIRRVHEIMMRIMKDYKIEHSMNNDNDESNEIDMGFTKDKNVKHTKTNFK